MGFLRTSICSVAVAVALLAACAGTPKRGPSPGEDAVRNGVVAIRITSQDVHWKDPWKRQTPKTKTAGGFVVAGNQIVVPGTELIAHTFIEVQKPATQDWYTATVKRLDLELPLALLEVPDAEFWAGLTPLPLAAKVPTSGQVTLCQNDGSRFECGDAFIHRHGAWTHGFGRISVLTLRTSRAADARGDGEVLLSAGHVVGLVTSRSNEAVFSMAAPVLRAFLEEASRPAYRGFARGGFSWQPLTNPALRRYLGMQPAEGGIRVLRVVPYESAAGVLESGDIILAVEGHTLDAAGRFQHPEYGPMPFHVMFSDGRAAGDIVQFRVLRKGERREVALKLRHTSAMDDRVMEHMVGQKPDYAIYGGLVFQHLSVPYLTTFGDWRAQGPLRLLIEQGLFGDLPTEDHPRTVLLTQVLPDPVNVGLQDLSNLIVSKVNGRPVRHLKDLREGFEKPAGAFHIVEFVPGQAASRIALDVEEVRAAEARVKAAY